MRLGERLVKWGLWIPAFGDICITWPFTLTPTLSHERERGLRKGLPRIGVRGRLFAGRNDECGYGNDGWADMEVTARERLEKAMVRYRAGAIGRTGRGNWGHGLDTAFVGQPGVDFVAVADDDPDGLQDAGARTGAGSLYGDYREMLERERLDFVAVCPRWLDGRAEMVIAAADAGVKGLFCEKPFARTLADAGRHVGGVRAGRDAGGGGASGRANPYEQRARAMVEEGAIGELQSLRGQGKCDHRSGAQDLMVLGTHMMDSMRYVAGSDVMWASGHVTQDGRDVTVDDIREGDEEMGLIAGNAVFATYAFKNGVTASFESQPVADPPGGSSSLFGFEAYGTRGIISVRNSPSGNMFVYPHSRWVPGSKDEWRPVVIEEWEQEQRERGVSSTTLSNKIIVKELIRAVEEDREVVVSSSGKDGRAAIEMIMAVHESHRLGKRVYFPMENRENPYEVWRGEESRK